MWLFYCFFIKQILLTHTYVAIVTVQLKLTLDYLNQWNVADSDLLSGLDVDLGIEDEVVVGEDDMGSVGQGSTL